MINMKKKERNGTKRHWINQVPLINLQKKL